MGRHTNSLLDKLAKQLNLLEYYPQELDQDFLKDYSREFIEIFGTEYAPLFSDYFLLNNILINNGFGIIL